LGFATPPVISEIFIFYSMRDAPSIEALFLKLMSGSLCIALADMFVLNLDAYRSSGTSFLNYSTRTIRLSIFCEVCLLLMRLLLIVESCAERLAVE
jgi:TRAP-type C4-dicarboxylate transport system permease large subunit